MSIDRLPARLAPVPASELGRRGPHPVFSFLFILTGIFATAVVLGAIVGVALRSAAEVDTNRWRESLSPTLRAVSKITLVRDVEVHPGPLDPITNYPLAVDLTIQLQHPCSSTGLSSATHYAQVVIDQQQVINLSGTVRCGTLEMRLSPSNSRSTTRG